MMDLSPFTRAGLKLKEIGSIVGVSHTTAGLWMRGQRGVHYLLEERVHPIVAAVDNAVEDGKLPLPATVPRGERLDLIKDIVDQYR